MVHIFLAHHLAVTLDMKMLGISIATAFHFFMRFAGIRILAHTDETLRRSMVPIMDEDSWKDLGPMFKIGFDCFLLKVMGWWAFDVFTQMAAFLEEDAVAAQTILRNIGLFTFMIPVGLSTAMNFFVGKYMGKNNVPMAKKFAELCNILTWIWSVASVVVVWFAQNKVMLFYTSDNDVIVVMQQAWYVLSIFVFFDCVQGVSSGHISGLGMQKDVRFVTMFSYWVVGIPLSAYLMFGDLQLSCEGLWYGPTAACLLNYIFY